MGSIKSDFNSLVSEISGPVSIDYLRSLLFDGLDPLDGRRAVGFGYSEAEKRLLLDLAETEKNKLSGIRAFKKPIWISSAGGPGAGKTTALFQYVAQLYHIKISKQEWSEPSLQTATHKIFSNIPVALVSPDKQGLMSLALHERHGPTSDAEFYKKWLGASYFLSRIILDVGFTLGLNVVHDTTLGGDSALKNLEAVRDRGYYVSVLMQGASLKTREEAAKRRNETFFQSLPNNVSAQDDSFAKKIREIVGLGDEIVIAWRDAADAPSKHVAMILDDRYLTVFDQKGFDKFCLVYPVMRDVAGKMEKKMPSEARGVLASIIDEEMRPPILPRKPMALNLSPA